jgi:hypothetical protein
LVVTMPKDDDGPSRMDRFLIGAKIRRMGEISPPKPGGYSQQQWRQNPN